MQKQRACVRFAIAVGPGRASPASGSSSFVLEASYLLFERICNLSVWMLLAANSVPSNTLEATIVSYAVARDWRGRFFYDERLLYALGHSRGLRRLWLRLRFRWRHGPPPA